MSLRLDIDQRQPLLRKSRTFRCNTNWYDVSWWGILLYVLTACLNYAIGYYIYRQMEWNTTVHSNVRIFGDIVTVGWFALGFVSLPWHQWESHTCIKTRDCMGVFRFFMWWIGTIATFFVYGYMGQFSIFQTSLASDHTPEQRNVYIVTFSVVGLIVLYWLAKLCPCSKRMCNLSSDHKFIFLRLIVIVSVLFGISYSVCKADECVYHLHHWWFGFVLVLLSTTVLENWFDYFLQGIFWTFLTESLFNYGLTFGEFFV